MHSEITATIPHPASRIPHPESLSRSTARGAIKAAAGRIRQDETLSVIEDALAGGAEVEIKLYIRQNEDGTVKVSASLKELFNRRQIYTAKRAPFDFTGPEITAAWTEAAAAPSH